MHLFLVALTAVQKLAVICVCVYMGIIVNIGVPNCFAYACYTFNLKKSHLVFPHFLNIL